MWYTEGMEYTLRDRIAKWTYLTVKRNGLGKRLIRGVWWVQRQVEKILLRLLRLLNLCLIPQLYTRGADLWSAEMSNKQLRGDGVKQD